MGHDQARTRVRGNARILHTLESVEGQATAL